MRIGACLLALVAVAAAQDLKANLEKKLAKPFFKNAAWIMDFDEAKRKANEVGKPIFAYFSRSYAP